MINREPIVKLRGQLHQPEQPLVDDCSLKRDREGEVSIMCVISRSAVLNIIVDFFFREISRLLEGSLLGFLFT